MDCIASFATELAEADLSETAAIISPDVSRHELVAAGPGIFEELAELLEAE